MVTPRRVKGDGGNLETRSAALGSRQQEEEEGEEELEVEEEEETLLRRLCAPVEEGAAATTSGRKHCCGEGAWRGQTVKARGDDSGVFLESGTS